MPEEGVQLTERDKLLTRSELVRLIELFAKYGVDKLRFTGGEPLVRKDCIEIIRDAKQIDGIKTISITTNGILLSRKIKDLKEAGLSGLNISLDTLEPKKFEFITKRNGWPQVMKGIESAINEGFSPLKVRHLTF